MQSVAGKYGATFGAEKAHTCIECSPGMYGTEVGKTSLSAACRACSMGQFRVAEISGAGAGG